jgi:molecular chaperone HscA
MSIHIVQGERDLVSDCRSLAKFILKDIPPMLAGVARINIQFQIDADGILSVSAKETSTNKVTTIEVKPSYGISDSEIEEMLRDSFDNAKEDIERRHLNESIVEGKRVILSINSALNIDGSNLLNKDEYKAICKARDELESKLSSGNKEIIINAIKNLENISETYVSRRMNASIREIMQGKDIKEYK